MTDTKQSQSTGGHQVSSSLVVPTDTERRFGPILALIRGSESMNNDERQYWINILPIMTQEQINNLEEILSSEKKQLAAIDKKYSTKDGSALNPSSSDLSEKIRERKAEREATERKDAVAEERAEDELLSKIESL